MSLTHLHLMLTHLPIFGSLLGSLVLGFGIWKNSNQTKIAACLLFIIAAVGAGVSYLTGESAEETVEKIQGVSEGIIKQHEAFAMFALVGLVILGISSVLVLFLNFKNSAFTRSATRFTLLISLISFALVARTGYLGGQIRHTEIGSVSNQNNGGQEKVGDDDD